MEKTLYLISYKLKDDYVDPRGWGDFGYIEDSFTSMEREANNRKFSRRVVVAHGKADAYKFIAERLGISMSKVRKDYELRRRKKLYSGKRQAGEWIYDQGALFYRSF